MARRLKREFVLWIALPPNLVVERLRAHLDGVGPANWLGLRGSNELVGKISDNSFWLQARPGGYNEPILQGVISGRGFGSCMRVCLTRRSLMPLLAAVALPLPLLSLLQGEALFFIFSCLAVFPTLVLLVLQHRGPLYETTWHRLRDIFTDVLLDCERAA